jgi:hypothetical protein
MWVAVQERPHQAMRRYDVWGLCITRHQSCPTVLVIRGGEIRADALLFERLLPPWSACPLTEYKADRQH